MGCLGIEACVSSHRMMAVLLTQSLGITAAAPAKSAGPGTAQPVITVTTTMAKNSLFISVGMFGLATVHCL